MNLNSEILQKIARNFKKAASGKLKESTICEAYIVGDKQSKSAILFYCGVKLLALKNGVLSVYLLHLDSQSWLDVINAALFEMGCGVVLVENGAVIYKASANDALNVEIKK